MIAASCVDSAVASAVAKMQKPPPAARCGAKNRLAQTGSSSESTTSVPSGDSSMANVMRPNQDGSIAGGMQRHSQMTALEIIISATHDEKASKRNGKRLWVGRAQPLTELQ